MAAASASNYKKEELSPSFDATGEPPPALFDRTTRLYISYVCPYAQHPSISMNFKQGLQNKIKLVPIDLKNRPTWYKEKVYSGNKIWVSSLEHNNEVNGKAWICSSISRSISRGHLCFLIVQMVPIQSFVLIWVEHQFSLLYSNLVVPCTCFYYYT